MKAQPSARPGAAPFRTRNSRRGRRVLAAGCGLVLAGIASLGALWPGTASASDDAAYPNRPVRVIVSYAAGNVTDTLARMIAEGLSAKWGQPVTVENRPGLGGSLGAQTASKAPADGHTLLFSAMAAMAINPHVYPNLGYDVARDFEPIVNVAYPDLMIVASPSLKIGSLTELVEFSKANPSALHYGTAGKGTVPHLNMEALKQRSGLVAQHVPYRGASAVLTDLIGGRIQLQQESSAVLLPHVKAGKLVPLATGGSKRHPQLPAVPTLGELYPGYESVIPWLGLFAPADTPPAIVVKVNRDVREILAGQAIREQLNARGLSIAGGSPQDFAAVVARDVARLGTLVKQLNLKAD